MEVSVAEDWPVVNGDNGIWLEVVQQAQDVKLFVDSEEREVPGHVWFGGQFTGEDDEVTTQIVVAFQFADTCANDERAAAFIRQRVRVRLDRQFMTVLNQMGAAVFPGETIERLSFDVPSVAGKLIADVLASLLIAWRACRTRTDVVGEIREMVSYGNRGCC